MSGRAFQADRVIWTKLRGRKDDMVREFSTHLGLSKRVSTVAGSFSVGLR